MIDDGDTATSNVAHVFFRTVAYVDLPNEKNERIVMRFWVPQASRALIEAFDKTGEAPAGGFKLVPPRGSKALEAKRLRGAIDRPKARERRKAVIAGEIEGVPQRGKKYDPLTLAGVRNGTGMVAMRHHGT